MGTFDEQHWGFSVSGINVDPFGNSRDATRPAWIDTHGYLNKPTDTLTATTHLGAREYDPTLGRFLSVDPILDPNQPQQNNAYSYAWNNPITGADPTGLMRVTMGDDGGGSASKPAPPGGGGAGLTASFFAAPCTWFGSCGASSYAGPAAPKRATAAPTHTAPKTKSLWWNPTTWSPRAKAIAGITLGVIAIGLGGWALLPVATGIYAVGAGVGAAAVGFGAAALDQEPCQAGEQAACVGRDLGYAGALGGALGAVGAGLVAGRVVAEFTLAPNIFAGAGAFGLQLGIGGTAADVGSALSSSKQRRER